MLPNPPINIFRYQYTQYFSINQYIFIAYQYIFIAYHLIGTRKCLIVNIKGLSMKQRLFNPIQTNDAIPSR